MRSLRIGLLTDVFLPDPNGVSTSVLLLQRELRRRGHRAVIVAPRFPDYLDPETLHGVVRLPSMVNPALPRQRLAFPTRRRLSGQFDLVHTHTPGAIGFWGARLAKRWDIPHISTFHTHLEHYAHYIPGMSTLERHAGVLTRIVRRFYEKADLVVAPTEASRDMLPSYGIYRPSVVLPTGIDESLLRDAPDVASPWPAGKRRSNTFATRRPLPNGTRKCCRTMWNTAPTTRTASGGCGLTATSKPPSTTPCRTTWIGCCADTHCSARWHLSAARSLKRCGRSGKS